MKEQNIEQILTKYGAIPTDWRHCMQELDEYYNPKTIVAQKESNNKGLFNKCLSSLILTKSSVSRAPIYTAIVLLLCWIVLMLHTLNFEFGTTSFGLQIMGHYFVK